MTVASESSELGRLRVVVISAKCQSYKRCTAVAPAVFGIGTDGKSTVLHPAGASEAEIVKAARSCPYRAIVVTRAESGEQLFPPVRAAKPPQ
jgi:ferredoxin